MFSKDFNELLSIFNDQRVEYLIIGGYAVAIHAQPRATKDLDLFVRADSENGKAIHAALARFGAPLEGITPDDLVEPGAFFRMGSAPFMVEIFPDIIGIRFDLAWERRVEVLLDEGSGLKATFVSEPDLIASKVAAGRPQDLADVDAIRKAAAARSGRRGAKPSAGPSVRSG